MMSHLILQYLQLEFEILALHAIWFFFEQIPKLLNKIILLQAQKLHPTVEVQRLEEFKREHGSVPEDPLDDFDADFWRQVVPDELQSVRLLIILMGLRVTVLLVRHELRATA